jgi:3,4-dihydroxy 2-butanone 4-phosphate synthase/GTP cyclohydrolase II
MFSSMKKIIQDAKKGKMFILIDDKNRENEGDLIIPASKIDHKKINFMATHARGLICLAIDKKKAKALKLSLMPNRNSSRLQTAFTVSIEARKGVTTGISAKDRALTIKTAIRKNSSSKDISTPGHIFPLVAKDGGVLERAGHTEAAVDISKLSNCGSSGVICEIMNEDGSMAKGKSLLKYAKKFKLNIARIEDLIAYRLKRETLIKLKRVEEVNITPNEKYKVKIYENKLDGKEHIALIKGKKIRGLPRVRVISSNIVTSFLSRNKDNLSINKTFKYFEKFQNCILIIIRDEVINNKDKRNNDSGLRNYGIGAQILRNLNVKKMILITKFKKNIIGLKGFGIKIIKQEIIK